MTTAPTTIFAPMFEDFEASRRDAENAWFDTDHVPQRLAIPGFLRAERHELSTVTALGFARSTPLRYLNYYFIESAEILASPDYQRSADHVTPRSRDYVAARFGIRQREVWQQRPSPWAGPEQLGLAEGTASSLVWLHEVSADGDAFLDGQFVPAMLGCAGFLDCRRFERVDIDLPGPRSERGPARMTIFDVASPELAVGPDVAELLALRGAEIGADGSAVAIDRQGVYVRRPSPWTIRRGPRA